MPEMGQLELYLLCRETKSRLLAFAQLVAECKQLDAAADFCRYVRNSGLLSLFKQNPQPSPLPVDGYLLEADVNELWQSVMNRFRTGEVQPQVDVAELQRISHKLDLIAGVLSKFPNLPKVDMQAPPLRVIEGGRDVV